MHYGDLRTNEDVTRLNDLVALLMALLIVEEDYKTSALSLKGKPCKHTP